LDIGEPCLVNTPMLQDFLWVTMSVL